MSRQTDRQTEALTGRTQASAGRKEAVSEQNDQATWHSDDSLSLFGGRPSQRERRFLTRFAFIPFDAIGGIAGEALGEVTVAVFGVGCPSHLQFKFIDLMFY